MAEHTDPREARLDRGYNALRAGTWEEAYGIFEVLLQEDPHCGLSCLGKAMALLQFHSREELAAHWEDLQQDPNFLKLLEPAKPDFLPWLIKDMAAAGKCKPEKAARRKGRTLDLSAMSPGRKLLLSFAGLQVLIFLVACCFFCKAQWDYAQPGISLVGNLLFGLMACGLPVILGPVYGNSILRAGKLRRLLKILNNLTALVGCFIHSILVAAFYSSLNTTAVSARPDRFLCYAFMACFLIHLLALIFPVILSRTGSSE